MNQLSYAVGLAAALALAPASLFAQRAPAVHDVSISKIADRSSATYGKGAPTGTVTFFVDGNSAPMRLEAMVDPALLRAAGATPTGTGKTLSASLLGKHFKEAKLVCRKQGNEAWGALARAAREKRPIGTLILGLKLKGHSTPYLEVKLQEVLVSSYQAGGHEGSSGGDRPTESLSINFTKIEFKYTPYDDQHKVG